MFVHLDEGKKPDSDKNFGFSALDNIHMRSLPCVDSIDIVASAKQPRMVSFPQNKSRQESYFWRFPRTTFSACHRTLHMSVLV